MAHDALTRGADLGFKIQRRRNSATRPAPFPLNPKSTPRVSASCAMESCLFHSFTFSRICCSTHSGTSPVIEPPSLNTSLMSRELR